ncbi:hypothetical protein ASE01_17165 [Nocardioides sp. Root190]|nr:hypothetical protein ASE01_17165 [Nocardioides sp. Root190]
MHRNLAEKTLRRAAIYSGGNWVSSTASGTMEHRNPTTGEVQGELVIAGSSEVDDAVSAARAALAGWRSTPADVKRSLLRSLADAIKANIDDLEVLGVLDNGNTRATVRAAALRGADFLDYYAGWPDKLSGLVIPSYPGDALNYTVPEPFGVVAAMVNWNGPLVATCRKIGPALAAGNTVVVKSPELAPFQVQRFAELCEAVGIPPGVVNIVPGGPETGAALVSHAGVDKVSFTGSTATAKKIMAAAAVNLTPVALELGGKAANIVCADADIEKAAAMAGMYGAVVNSGQGCLLPTLLLVEDGIYDAFMDRVVSVVESVKIGDPLDRATAMGPLISSGARDRVASIIDGAAASGGSTLLTGGARLGGEFEDGYFLQPTIFGDVDPHAKIAREEIFGPVLSALRFDSEEEALSIAHGTRYALSGFVHTNDVRRAHRMAGALKAGSVSVNGINPLAPSVPFGGSGDSGFGREGGEEGLLEFVRTKNVYVSL